MGIFNKMRLTYTCSIHHHIKTCALCFVLCLLFGAHIHKCEKHDHGISYTPDTAPYAESKTSETELYKSHTKGNKVNVKKYISKLFDRYGENGIMSFEAFEHMLHNLGLGELDHDLEDHFVDGEFREMHDLKHYHEPKQYDHHVHNSTQENHDSHYDYDSYGDHGLHEDHDHHSSHQVHIHEEHESDEGHDSAEDHHLAENHHLTEDHEVEGQHGTEAHNEESATHFTHPLHESHTHHEIRPINNDHKPQYNSKTMGYELETESHKANGKHEEEEFGLFSHEINIHKFDSEENPTDVEGEDTGNHSHSHDDHEHNNNNNDSHSTESYSQGELYVFRQRGKEVQSQIPHYKDATDEEPTVSYRLTITTVREKIKGKHQHNRYEPTESLKNFAENQSESDSGAPSRFHSRKLSSLKPVLVTTTESSFESAKDRQQREIHHQEFILGLKKHNLRHQKRLRRKQRKQRKEKGRGSDESIMSAPKETIEDKKQQRSQPLDRLNRRRMNQKDGGIHRSRRHADHKPYDEVANECFSSHEILGALETEDHSTIKGVTQEQFIEICPLLVYELDIGACQSKYSKEHPGEGYPHNHPGDYHSEHDSGDPDHRKHTYHEEVWDNGVAHDHDHTENEGHVTGYKQVASIPFKVWVYALISVTVISLVGLVGVAVVPIMQKVFYNHLLQFLVALAIGSLAGDALLHLLPHSMMPGDGGSHDHGSGDGGHTHSKDGIWKGLVALGGVYFFFLTERLMGIMTEWRRKINKKKSKLSSPKVYHTCDEHDTEIGAKLSHHRDAVTSCEEIMMMVHPSKDVRVMPEDLHEEIHQNCDGMSADEKIMSTNTVAPAESAGHSDSHSHHHHHGHSHDVPNSIASVAWMVIMGDGLHNFSDGLAIGAAFANSISGGLSTSVAVFCHELPHEIGDFAVLLRAGMSVRQALVYNCVSSVLCLIGMVVGVCVGNIGSVSLWIFALAGGMFIYIALVDMLPEIMAVNQKAGENPLVHLFLQSIGMFVGAGIMLLIAIYEDSIKLPHFEP